MKHARKFLSLLMALVMVLAMGTTAFAAENDGSITIRNATKEETYSVYKVFDLTYSNVTDEDGNVVKTNVAYTYTSTGEGDAFLDALQGDSPFELIELGNGVYSVSSEEGAETISAWLIAQKALLGDPVDSKVATGAEVKFEGLDYGYYYITSSLGSVVTIDSTLKDVTVVDKNQGPSWDNEPENPGEGEDKNPGKVIVNADGSKTTVNSAKYGDTVNFNISVNATAYDGDKLVTYYYITDTLDAGFSPAENIVVKVGNQTLAKDTDYTLDQNGQKFDIRIPFGEKYGSNAKIEITYSATVETDAVIAGSGNLNTANFTYDTKATDPDDPDQPTVPTDPDYPKPSENPGYEDSNKKTTTTYVYALGIEKVDPTGNALTGAEFSVKKGDTVIKAVQAKDENDAPIPGVYEYSTATDAVSQFATNDDGILIIKGLAEGAYSVKEEVAPLGYNLLPDSVNVTASIENTSTYTETITTYYDADGNVNYTETEGATGKTTTFGTKVVPCVVVNHAGAELPSTGGVGTTIFYVLGGILVLGAAVLLITKKRMSNNR